MQPVHFYAPGDEYGELSNIFPSPFAVEGVSYFSNEHHFQANKFVDQAYQSKIISDPDPLNAFTYGQSRQYPIRKNWGEVKEQVMMVGLKHKFTQNARCREALLATGDRPIVEHTVHDSYWGDGGDGSGKNRLGILLMQLRQELRQN